MKKLVYTFLISLIFTSISFAQNPDAYKKIDYIKVNGDRIGQFLDLAENDLKTAYNNLTESTDLIRWDLYKVQYPGGEKSHYDFISIVTAKSVGFFEDQFSDKTKLQFIPSDAGDDFSDISTLVKSEIWKIENDTLLDDEAQSKYMTMDYMDVAPGKGLDYLMLEDEVAKPIHEERIDQQKMAGWEVYSLILPSGTDYGYNYATGNYFDSLSHIEFGFTNEIIQQAMGNNSNIPELFGTIYSTRDLVKVELWKLVSHTD